MGLEVKRKTGMLPINHMRVAKYMNANMTVYMCTSSERVIYLANSKSACGA